jgi:hypothetical protein
VPALVSPLGGSRFLVVVLSERRPDTQIALSVRPRAADAVAECFSFLAGLELSEDLPCLTVDDDEWLQGAELLGAPTQRRKSPISSARWRSVSPPRVFEGAMRHWLRERPALAGPTLGSASRRS